MTSPQSPLSTAPSFLDPTTPQSLPPSHRSSLDASGGAENTPRAARKPARTFNRRISLPKAPSAYYDPYDPTTHNLEYASKVSGIDFVAEAEAARKAKQPLLDTLNQSAKVPGSPTQSGPKARSATARHSVGGSSSSGRRTPDTSPIATSGAQDAQPHSGTLPRLGRLVSTSESFAPITLDLNRNWTSWGRLEENTIIYPDPCDTRIPKKAFTIWFNAPSADVKSLDDHGEDWTHLPELQCGIFTCAKSGIWVNGTRLLQNDAKGRAHFGHLHTGDVIQVFLSPASGACLQFRCEFYLGEGMDVRPPDQPFRVQTSKTLLTNPAPHKDKVPASGSSSSK